MCAVSSVSSGAGGTPTFRPPGPLTARALQFFLFFLLVEGAGASEREGVASESDRGERASEREWRARGRSENGERASVREGARAREREEIERGARDRGRR
jgi:hypothetical protein